MTSQSDLSRLIADLEQLLQNQALSEAARETLQTARSRLLTDLEPQHEPEAAQGMEAKVDVGAPVTGSVTGINEGIILAFYGESHGSKAQELVKSYFETIIETYDQPNLTKLLNADTISWPSGHAPTITLSTMFISLTTNWRVHREKFASSPHELLSAMDEHDPSHMPPEYVWLPVFDSTMDRITTVEWYSGNSLMNQWMSARAELTRLASSEAMISGVWCQPELAIDAIMHNRRLVLLGNPGSGKSTVLLYLAVRIAQELLSGKDHIRLTERSELSPAPIPFFCSLKDLAQHLDDNLDNDLNYLIDSLLAPVESVIRPGIRESMFSAWRNGRGLLLLDGLDEVSPIREKVRSERTRLTSIKSRRERLVDAISRLGQQIRRSYIVVTCRARVYEQNNTSQFPNEWVVRKVEPFSFGQMRSFIKRWYGQVLHDNELGAGSDQLQASRVKDLIDMLERTEKLKEIASSPLMLQMLMLLHYSNVHLPDERVDLCEDLVTLLLERWELVRSQMDVHVRQSVSLADYLAIPDFTSKDINGLRALIHVVALKAHHQSNRELGTIPKATLRSAIDLFFAAREDPIHPEAVERKVYVEHSDRLLHFVCDECGLFQPADEEGGEVNLAFPHLMLQEYLAACWLAEQQNAAILARNLWLKNADRWREPLLLMLGRLGRLTKITEIQMFLDELLSLAQEDKNEISPIRRVQHLEFAETCLAVLGGQSGMVELLHRSNAPNYVVQVFGLRDLVHVGDADELRMTRFVQDIADIGKKLQKLLSSAQKAEQTEQVGVVVVGERDNDETTLSAYYYRLTTTLGILRFRGLDEALDRSSRVQFSHTYVPLIIMHKSRTLTEQQYDSQPIQVSEALLKHRRMVLLGDPGSGKSSFIRYVAWVLATAAVAGEQIERLAGWSPMDQRVPFIVSVRSISNRIVRDGASGITLYNVLHETVESIYPGIVDRLIQGVLTQGKALVMVDGLDEAPNNGVAGTIASRAEVLDTVKDFANLYPQTMLVLTCRIHSFDEVLKAKLGWPAETIAPLNLDQIRAFAHAWFSELASANVLQQNQAEVLSSALITGIIGKVGLLTLASSPLLLTMMALVLYNKGELSRDRPQLYERILDLLLGQWNQVHEGKSLAEVVGMPEWESRDFLPPLDRLAYKMHRDTAAASGGGGIAYEDILLELSTFFQDAKVNDPKAAAVRFLDYIEHRSGLLVSYDNHTFMFAHLILQEHCAGRHMALGTDDPVALILQHRTEDRWREAIFLGVSLMRPAEVQTLLAELLLREGKTDERWYRDLILAAEIGQDRDWNYLRTRPMIKVERLQRELRAGLVTLLADKAQPLRVAERVRAGFLLGDLGDPRVPVTLDDWRREIDRAMAGDTSGYLCRVDAGTYIVGSPADDPDARDEEKLLHSVIFDAPFWIARYPITNDQWQVWVRDGGEASAFAENGEFNHSNQPVVTVTWYQCNAFCEWLSGRLGEIVRLPTEFEWEAAARGGDARRYPWGDEWLDDFAAMEEDRETRGSRCTVPVGCYPAGASPCGALDMVGNVWEWSVSKWRSYPGAEKSFIDDTARVLRGGCYANDRTFVRCGARNWVFPLNRDYDNGFRVIVAPGLA